MRNSNIPVTVGTGIMCKNERYNAKLRYMTLISFENSVDPDWLASEMLANQNPHCFPLGY